VANERAKRPGNGGAALVSTSARGAVREFKIPVECDLHIIGARQKGRELACDVGLSPGDATLVATAISELARNIILYAKRGHIILQSITRGDTPGIAIIARDEGPGIPDIRRALQDGYSTSSSLGLGLPGVRRLMDEFDIVSEVDRGTWVTVRKWRR
jgi:serine/threonine-protein kinase RsbT